MLSRLFISIHQFLCGILCTNPLLADIWEEKAHTSNRTSSSVEDTDLNQGKVLDPKEDKEEAKMSKAVSTLAKQKTQEKRQKRIELASTAIPTPKARSEYADHRNNGLDLSKPPVAKSDSGRFETAETKRWLIAANKMNGYKNEKKACALTYDVTSVEMAHVLPHSDWIIRGGSIWLKFSGILPHDGRNIKKLNAFKTSAGNIIWLRGEYADMLEPKKGQLFLFPDTTRIIKKGDEFFSTCDSFGTFTPDAILNNWSNDDADKITIKVKKVRKGESEEEIEEQEDENVDDNENQDGNEESDKKQDQYRNVYSYQIWLASSREELEEGALGVSRDTLTLQYQGKKQKHNLDEEAPINILPLQYEPVIHERKFALHPYIVMIVSLMTMQHRVHDEKDPSHALEPTEVACLKEEHVEYILSCAESEHPNDYETCDDIKKLRPKELGEAPKYQGTCDPTDCKRQYSAGDYYYHYREVVEQALAEEAAAAAATTTTTVAIEQNQVIQDSDRLTQANGVSETDSIAGAKQTAATNILPSPGNSSDEADDEDEDQVVPPSEPCSQIPRHRLPSRDDGTNGQAKKASFNTTALQFSRRGAERDSNSSQSQGRSKGSSRSDQDNYSQFYHATDSDLPPSLDSILRRRPFSDLNQEYSSPDTSLTDNTPSKRGNFAALSPRELEEIEWYFEIVEKYRRRGIECDQEDTWDREDISMDLCRKLDEAEIPYSIKREREILLSFYKQEVRVGYRLACKWLRSCGRHDYDDAIDELYLEWKREAINIYKQEHM